MLFDEARKHALKENKKPGKTKSSKSYLTNRDIRPVYPRRVWKADPIIIAPCSSFIICLNFWKLI
jgi:cytosine/uracil/thiamine/allantoin permease